MLIINPLCGLLPGSRALLHRSVFCCMAVLTWLFSQVVVRPLGAAAGPTPLASYTPDLVRRLTRHDPLASSEFGHLAAISRMAGDAGPGQDRAAKARDATACTPVGSSAAGRVFAATRMGVPPVGVEPTRGTLLGGRPLPLGYGGWVMIPRQVRTILA